MTKQKKVCRTNKKGNDFKAKSGKSNSKGKVILSIIATLMLATLVGGLCAFFVNKNNKPTPPVNPPQSEQGTYSVNTIKLSNEELRQYDISKTIITGDSVVENFTKSITCSIIDESKNKIINLVFDKPDYYVTNERDLNYSLFLDYEKILKDNNIDFDLSFFKGVVHTFGNRLNGMFLFNFVGSNSDSSLVNGLHLICTDTFKDFATDIKVAIYV